MQAMRPAASEKSGWAARLALVAALGITPSAYAYRPFDGTDAAIADPKELEFEFQPAGLLIESSQRSLVAPALIANLGVVESWEMVGQGQVEVPISGGSTRITEDAILAKHIMRPGSFQEKSGPSMAIEFGALLPERHGDAHLGAVSDFILSESTRWGAFHVNVQPGLATDAHFDLFLDLILEGPHSWTVRPAAELFLDRHYDASETRSALIGAIWQVREKLAVDVGVRRADMDAGAITELRAGVTFSVSPR